MSNKELAQKLTAVTLAVQCGMDYVEKAKRTLDADNLYIIEAYLQKAKDKLEGVTKELWQTN